MTWHSVVGSVDKELLMWKQVLGALVLFGILTAVACGGGAKQVKPSGTDGGTTEAPAAAESQPSH